MKFSYEVILEEVAIAQTRFFLKSKIAKKNKWISTLLMVPCVSIPLIYILSPFEQYTLLIILIFTSLSTGYQYFSFNKTSLKRIRSHLKMTYQDKLPAQVDYQFSDTEITSETFGVVTIFKIKNITSVFEDQEQLVIEFGNNACCSIPLRVFNPQTKQELLSLLNANSVLSE